jgi:DNA-binding PadR family transcriptional regulator
MKERTLLDYALLGLIDLQAQTGYGLRQVFEKTPMGNYSSSPGSIYPALRRLERNGLVKGERVPGKGRDRRLYRPTAAAKSALRRWMLQQVAVEDIKHDMSGLMLRFAFMGKFLRKDEVHKFLDALRDALSTYVENLRTHLERHASTMPLHGRLALESGLEQYRSHLRWVGRAQEGIS